MLWLWKVSLKVVSVFSLKGHFCLTRSKILRQMSLLKKSKNPLDGKNKMTYFGIFLRVNQYDKGSRKKFFF